MMSISRSLYISLFCLCTFESQLFAQGIPDVSYDDISTYIYTYMHTRVNQKERYIVLFHKIFDTGHCCFHITFWPALVYESGIKRCTRSRLNECQWCLCLSSEQKCVYNWKPKPVTSNSFSLIEPPWLIRRNVNNIRYSDLLTALIHNGRRGLYFRSYRRPKI